MPAYLLSGPSGSGKTTIGSYLAGHGYRIIETDHEPGLSGYQNRKTGEKAPERPAYPLPKDWLEIYGWGWGKQRMEVLLQGAQRETVFFCGGAINEKDFFSRFALRFALCTDDAILTQRLQSREPERWTIESFELKNMLDWNRKFRNYSTQNGAVIINSTLSPEICANHILTIIHKAEHELLNWES